MAEFVEVMEQINRMCDKYSEKECQGCPIDSICIRFDPNLFAHDDFKKVEDAVVQWAKKNPAKAYPTWEQWQKEQFPCGSNYILPCMFMSSYKTKALYSHNCDIACVKCRKYPIPADIAEKLGIEPIVQKVEEERV